MKPKKYIKFAVAIVGIVVLSSCALFQDRPACPAYVRVQKTQKKC